jgi:hypothetical protein
MTEINKEDLIRIERLKAYGASLDTLVKAYGKLVISDNKTTWSIEETNKLIREFLNHIKESR